MLQLDAPISIELPPKETKSSDRRRAALQQPRTAARSTPSSNSSATSASAKRSRSLAVSADYLASWKSRSIVDGSNFHFLSFFLPLHFAGPEVFGCRNKNGLRSGILRGGENGNWRCCCALPFHD